MTKTIEFTFPEGDQSDLEHLLSVEMINRAKADIQYAVKNPWGEFLILQGKTLHGVQWSYVGLEIGWDWDEVEQKESYNYYWNVGYNADGTLSTEPDFEIDCSWQEEENYCG